MPQSCDMGPTALLPLRRLRLGLYPWILVSEASRLTTRPPKPLLFRYQTNIHPAQPLLKTTSVFMVCCTLQLKMSVWGENYEICKVGGYLFCERRLFHTNILFLRFAILCKTHLTQPELCVQQTSLTHVVELLQSHFKLFVFMFMLM
jgi:hypothetical protein